MQITFLPIIDRELRVAARKRGTYWSRVAAAIIAMVLTGSFLLVWSIANQIAGGAKGQILFSILKWLCFGSACSAGLFLTSDCLSEEKRDGTLGLLFLTDLRGYDVVGGKIIATGLRAFFALLAIFPVLALTLMLGGVMGLEFWRTLLALCNGLFFSLAVGMLISAISRDALKAMSATLLLCVIILGGLPLFDLWLASWDAKKFDAKLTFASPVYAFLLAPPAGRSAFWPALAISNGVGWFCILLASLGLPRSWQEKAVRPERSQNGFRRRWRFVSRKRRVRWLENNPLVWLAGRDLWLARCALVVVLGASVLAACLYLRLERDAFYDPLESIHLLLLVTLCLWVAAQANRFPAELRRTGVAELILCTPVTVRQILRGQWAALQGMFVVPACIILVFQVVLTTLTLQRFGRGSGQTPVVKWAGHSFSQFEVSQILSAISSGVGFATTLCALAWFGMWMGLTTRKATVGVLKTLAFVAVLPWLGLGIVEILISFLTVRARLPFWTDTAVFTGAWLAKDILFVVWSRWRLRRRFRDVVAFGNRRKRLVAQEGIG